MAKATEKIEGDLSKKKTNKQKIGKAKKYERKKKSSVKRQKRYLAKMTDEQREEVRRKARERYRRKKELNLVTSISELSKNEQEEREKRKTETHVSKYRENEKNEGKSLQIEVKSRRGRKKINKIKPEEKVTTLETTTSEEKLTFGRDTINNEKLKGNAVVIDNEESSVAIKEENQSTILLDNTTINSNFILENIEIKNEEPLIIESEETESETLNLVLSEPFTLKENINFVDKECLDESTDNPDESSKPMQIQDIAENTVNSEPFTLKENVNFVDKECLDESTDNPDESSKPMQIQDIVENTVNSGPFTLKENVSFVDKECLDESTDNPNESIKPMQIQDIVENTVNSETLLSRKSPDIDHVNGLVGEPSVKIDDSRIESDKKEEAKLNLNIEETARSNTHVVTSSMRNKRSIDTKNKKQSIDHTTGTPRKKKNKTVSEFTPPSQENSEISIVRNNANKQKKLNCMKSKKKNMWKETDFKIKPCSIVIEKTIANQMKATDVCMVSRIGILKDSFVLQSKTQPSATVEFENKALYERLVTTKNIIQTRYSILFPQPLSGLKQNITDQKQTNDNGPNSLPLEDTVETHSTKDLIQKSYSNLVTQNLCGLKQNNITDPTKTNNNNDLDSLLLKATVPSTVSPLPLCKSMVKCQQQKLILSPDGSGSEIVSQPTKEVSVIEIIENVQGNEVILPPCNKNLSPEKPEDSEKVIEYLRGNKALSLQLVDNNAPLKQCLNTTPPPTAPTSSSNPEYLRGNKALSLQLVDNNAPLKQCLNTTPPPTAPTSSSNPMKQIHSKTEPKQLNLEDLLDGTPPFIQEVFKCENMRDGFINEDLIFVLSLLPDMDEMADREKLKFQLRVIETISDVFSDPVLQS